LDTYVEKNVEENVEEAKRNILKSYPEAIISTLSN
jgi:hypothetical protein